MRPAVSTIVMSAQRPVRRALFLLVCLTVLVGGSAKSLYAQGTSAAINGQITDSQGRIVPGVEVQAVNIDTNVVNSGKTNDSGIYAIPALPPGRYRLLVLKDGFKEINKTGLVLHVQDTLEQNFALEVGSISESVTVEAGGLVINTTDAAVSTVIDRNFVERLPLNGRSFNTLLQLTPGVVIAPISNAGAPGQFSIAGQRTDANNFTVDGVSANFGVGPGQNPGQSGTGGAQAFSALGGTSSLVSVDALQEFRVETSSFAPEFGRTPGGQVILSTRSGTNDFHGGVFDYFRNTVMDANDWFSNAAIPQIPRAPEHHNDFGGVLGGPIWRDKAFFFLSYEGARLDQPTTAVIQVPYISPSVPACSAPQAIAPFLEAYPKPNGPISTASCTGQFTGSFSNRGTLDAGSIRIDHRFNERFMIFGRYNDAPSESLDPISSLSTVQTTTVNTKTVTGGVNMLLGAALSNTVRGNYSAQTSALSYGLDSFGGAVPPSTSLLLGPFPSQRNFAFFFSPDTTFYLVGTNGQNKTKQANFTDDLSISAGVHQLKFGGDYRAIFLNADPFLNGADYFVSSTQAFLSTGSAFLSTSTSLPSKFLVQSLSLYGQDTWKVTPRLTLTYGLRWELNPAPSARGGTKLAAWENTNNPPKITLAPFGTPLWATTYGNFAPRFGVAYSLTSRGDFVVRAGAGIFYDLGVGSSAALAYSFPNLFSSNLLTVSLPVTDLTSLLPVISFQPPYVSGQGFASDLKLPRSYQWNAALEKSFGGKQAISLTYVGQSGRDLLRNEILGAPNANFANSFQLTLNEAHSNYDALQLQYRRPLSSRLQALLNYTWAHSVDNVSEDISLGVSHTIISAAGDYASSDFDVRHTFSGALSYDVPAAAKSGALALFTKGWSLDTVVVARTGFPFNAVLAAPSSFGGVQYSRPDLVPGQPLYLRGSLCASVFQGLGVLQQGQVCPGGQGLNPNAFSIPSTPRQGTESRNDIRGFGFTQVDVSISRKFPITERLNLQFRADAFNVLNHPNFANPFPQVDSGPSTLLSTQMLNQGLGQGSGLSPLFQQGGPRSLQLSLKMNF